MLRITFCLTLASFAAGCGHDGPTPAGAPQRDQPTVSVAGQALADGKQYLLTAEPPGARGVIDVRKYAKDGDEVVVAGRVGGSSKPFTASRASFLIVDPSLKPTAECDTPWDFCEYPKAEVAAARLNVKFVDADGKTFRGGARELFGIKELSGVVVKGKVSRDDKDNV